MKRPVEWICAVSVFLSPGIAFAAETAPDPWWKVASGILAIPASLVGLAYSYVLIKKTRLEAQKTELEIREKQSKLQDLAAREPEAAKQLIAPIVEGRATQFLLLRFVLLYVVLRAWSLVETVVQFTLKAAFAGILSLFKSVDDSSLVVVVPFFALSALPTIGYWFIFFAIGWPLVRDINASLKINVRELFFWWKQKG
ncbi:MAG: hypothetical protein ACLQBD_29780 [Syntrophobacteraceae bacterium]